MALSILLTGCMGCGLGEESPQSTTTVVSEGFIGMCGTDYVSNVRTMHQIPGVLIDQTGYDPVAAKEVIFYGSRLSAHYSICDADTGEVVYSGVIQNIEDVAGTDQTPASESEHTISDHKIGYGDFTEFQTEGRYYIKTDYIGESYPFEIRTQISEEQYRSMLSAYEEIFRESTGSYVEGSLYENASVIADLILSYRLYPEIFTDDLSPTSGGNGIPDLLDMIKIYIDWVLDLQIDTIHGSELASYAGILAEFSQIYKEFDNSYAKDCRSAAEAVYSTMQTEMNAEMQTETQDELADSENGSVYFYATVQLYLVTGYNRYHQAVKEMLSDESGIDGDENFLLLGWVGYLSGKKGVDLALCSQIMEQLMNQCEAISAQSRDNSFHICDSDIPRMLQKLQYLAVMDYAVSSQEYRTILESHYHYILGANPQAVNYRDAFDARQNAMLLFVMSEIAESGL